VIFLFFFVVKTKLNGKLYFNLPNRTFNTRFVIAFVIEFVIEFVVALVIAFVIDKLTLAITFKFASAIRIIFINGAETIGYTTNIQKQMPIPTTLIADSSFLTLDGF